MKETGLNFKLIINQNRAQIISYKYNRLSVHEMFLKAPMEILLALSRFLKRRDKKASKILQIFIQQQSAKIDHSHRVKHLNSLGKIYDLKEIYNENQCLYFQEDLNLKITWSKPGKGVNHIVFGRYYDSLKLIKINQMMDDPFFPKEFVSLVVYHEMLHHSIPGYYDAKGNFRLHSPEFKAAEKKFIDYKSCQKWLKAHKQVIFNRQKALSLVKIH